MNLFFCLLIILLQSNLIFSQSIPKNHYLFQSKKLFYDSGKDWKSLTTFGPIRFEIKEIIEKTHIDGQLGFNSENDSYSFKGSGRVKYKSYYYGYFYPSVVYKKNNNQPSNTGVKIFGSEDDQSGLGFENSWLILQIGKGRESWGAGNNIELALSQKSGTYDYLLLGSDYGNIRVRYIHGFLEKIEPNINRYITARGLEWTNKRSFILGFSETVIYSGENRSMDIGYINPMSSHLEIELNDRLNIIGDGYANAVWQIHLDYLLNKNLRFSFNYLYDEFVIDQKIQINKEHGKAFSVRLAYTPLFSETHLFTLYSSLVYVGTPTFRHGNGTNNFVHQGRPLGWHKGSDGQDYSVGINYFNNNDIILSISTGLLESGEETITTRIFESYVDYLAGSFPSGQVKKTFYVETKFTYQWKEYYTVSSTLYWSSNIDVFDYKVSFQLSQPF